VRTARFTAWNSQKALLESQGVKLTGINATVAQDLEPEYTAFSADEKTAFVTLQVRA
jgi:3-phytase